MECIDRARAEGRSILSEHESKQLLAAYGLPVTREAFANSREEVLEAGRSIGYPLVLKGCSAEVAHKSEQGLVFIDLRTEAEAVAAFDTLSARLPAGAGILVQEFVKGDRELAAGMIRDPQFGPCVMFGLGGIYAEVLRDVCFRVAPLDENDAQEMLDEIRGRAILGAARGAPPADRERLAAALVALGEIGVREPHVKEIDVNPLILRDGRPVAVDALVVLGG